MGREGGFLNRLLQKVYNTAGKCGEISLLWGSCDKKCWLNALKIGLKGLFYGV